MGATVVAAVAGEQWVLRRLVQVRRLAALFPARIPGSGGKWILRRVARANEEIPMRGKQIVVTAAVALAVVIGYHTYMARKAG